MQIQVNRLRAASKQLSLITKSSPEKIVDIALGISRNSL